MPQKVFTLTLISATVMALGAANASKPAATALSKENVNISSLWREPTDISTRNLFYGSGGEEHQPNGPYTFVQEDMDGTSPKYVIRDKNNVKWTVKLGMEARPETVATRLVWAAGYFTNDDYLLEDLQVNGMPSHLQRGRKLIGADGTLHVARLKRHVGDEKNEGDWPWRDDAFAGTRELNGLKVMMALINNWDLKDMNNKVYGGKDGQEPIYLVSDLGASFGASGLSFPFSHSKGYVKAYEQSKFITKVTPEYVDFRTPSRPSLVYAATPSAFIKRTRLDTLVHHIPLDDARWIGHLLSALTPGQIHDAFRAAGYPPDQVNAYSSVVKARIAQLNAL